MQLPDWCFGRRWVVSCELGATAGTTVWDISEVALPDAGVIWQLSLNIIYSMDPTNTIRLALGDILPTTTVIMDELEPLVHGIGVQGAEPRQKHVHAYGKGFDIRMRTPRTFQSKKMVMEATAVAGELNYAQAIMVVSSIPLEVPDWLISG